jgi:hypothetical protein
MKPYRLLLVVLVVTATACADGCLGPGEVPRANEKLPGQWTVDGETRTLETGFVSPKIARVGEQASFEVYLPPGTTRALGAVSPGFDTSCTYEYPCTPSEDWMELEFDPGSKIWRGDIPLTEEIVESWDAERGLIPTARVLYRARETRFDILSRSFVIASESRGTYWVANASDVNDLCPADPAKPCIVRGDLYAFEWVGDSLGPLAKVDTVWGDLVVGFNEDLMNLSGIEDISVGALRVFDNPRLRSLQPLEGTVRLREFYVGSLSSLEAPIDLQFMDYGPVDLRNPPTYEFRSVPVTSDILSSFPRFSRITLTGELGTSLIAGGGDVILNNVMIRNTDVERIEVPPVERTSIEDNRALRSIIIAPGFGSSTRHVDIQANESLEMLSFPPDESFDISIFDAPSLRSIDGLDSLGAQSRLFVNDAPNMRRCEIESVLPAEVLERSDFFNIGECD